MSGASLLEAARPVGDAARRCADETEAGRRLAPGVVEAFEASGLGAALAPPAIGGSGADVRALLEALEAISAADASTGWCCAIATGSNYLAALPPEATARELFRDLRKGGAGPFAPGSMAMPNGAWCCADRRAVVLRQQLPAGRGARCRRRAVRRPRADRRAGWHRARPRVPRRLRLRGGGVLGHGGAARDRQPRRRRRARDRPGRGWHPCGHRSGRTRRCTGCARSTCSARACRWCRSASGAPRWTCSATKTVRDAAGAPSPSIRTRLADDPVAQLRVGQAELRLATARTMLIDLVGQALEAGGAGTEPSRRTSALIGLACGRGAGSRARRGADGDRAARVERRP